MKRYVVAAWLVLAFAVAALAAPVTILNPYGSNTGLGVTWTLLDSVEVVGTDDGCSSAINLERAGVFGLAGGCTGTTPDVELVWQAAPINDSVAFVETDVLVANCTAVLEPAPFSPPPAQYGRVCWTGNGGNGSATVDVYVFTQGAIK